MSATWKSYHYRLDNYFPFFGEGLINTRDDFVIALRVLKAIKVNYKVTYVTTQIITN